MYLIEFLPGLNALIRIKYLDQCKQSLLSACCHSYFIPGTHLYVWDIPHSFRLLGPHIILFPWHVFLLPIWQTFFFFGDPFPTSFRLRSLPCLPSTKLIISFSVFPLQFIETAIIALITLYCELLFKCPPTTTSHPWELTLRFCFVLFFSLLFFPAANTRLGERSDMIVTLAGEEVYEWKGRC